MMKTHIQIIDIGLQRCTHASKLLLTTNRTRFRLVPKSMTLKGNNSLCYIMRLPFGTITKISMNTHTISGRNVEHRLYFVRTSGYADIHGGSLKGHQMRAVLSKIATFASCSCYIFEISNMRPKLCLSYGCAVFKI